MPAPPLSVTSKACPTLIAPALADNEQVDTQADKQVSVRVVDSVLD